MVPNNEEFKRYTKNPRKSMTALTTRFNKKTLGSSAGCLALEFSNKISFAADLSEYREMFSEAIESAKPKVKQDISIIQKNGKDCRLFKESSVDEVCLWTIDFFLFPESRYTAVYCGADYFFYVAMAISHQKTTERQKARMDNEYPLQANKEMDVNRLYITRYNCIQSASTRPSTEVPKQRSSALHELLQDLQQINCRYMNLSKERETSYLKESNLVIDKIAKLYATNVRNRDSVIPLVDSDASVLLSGSSAPVSVTPTRHQNKKKASSKPPPTIPLSATSVAGKIKTASSSNDSGLNFATSGVSHVPKVGPSNSILDSNQPRQKQVPTLSEQEEQPDTLSDAASKEDSVPSHDEDVEAQSSSQNSDNGSVTTNNKEYDWEYTSSSDSFIDKTSDNEDINEGDKPYTATDTEHTEEEIVVDSDASDSSVLTAQSNKSGTSLGEKRKYATRSTNNKMPRRRYTRKKKTQRNDRSTKKSRKA